MDFVNFTRSSIEVNSTNVFTTVDSSLSEYVNLSTTTAEALQSTMTSTATALLCGHDTTPCSDNSYCLNGGLCCEHFGVKHCLCTSEYTGVRCARKKEDFIRFFEAVEIIADRDERIVHAGVSSVISMIIGLLALAACIIVVVLVRKKLLLKKHSEHYLEEHLSDIQQELDSLPTVSKLVQLTRLSKMFQQSARVAIETTVLSADVGRMVVSPSPHVACLPRWSSAPASLGAGARPTAEADADEPDTTSPTYVAPSVRRKLKQVFSYDVGVMARSQEHAQQQQPLPGNDDDGARTTRL